MRYRSIGGREDLPVQVAALTGFLVSGFTAWNLNP